MRPVMAKRNVEMMKQAEPAITRGTGNVFADLGYVDAEERQTKLRLAHAQRPCSFAPPKHQGRIGSAKAK